MRYIVEIEQATTVPLVVEAHSEREALKLAEHQLHHPAIIAPENMGDPIAKPPLIRSVRKLGE
ncbi:hypothetical protein SAMN05660479_01474 [Microbulbifer thermotolerans]|uniref:hypothetical protein n=1 Tax=Microbulbifer thermotolerans TaxID=252514 RepID=UPI0008EBCA1A|nr:hypothetical protein [Microbulbifer thermotolerans]SFC31679.1 hypothetical protein SAMN05660479_01474 [Microbulbifer thermotolerans]